MLQASGVGNGATNSHDPPAGDDVIVYLVGAETALFTGAVNATLAAPLKLLQLRYLVHQV